MHVCFGCESLKLLFDMWIADNFVIGELSCTIIPEFDVMFKDLLQVLYYI